MLPATGFVLDDVEFDDSRRLSTFNETAEEFSKLYPVIPALICQGPYPLVPQQTLWRPLDQPIAGDVLASSNIRLPTPGLQILKVWVNIRITSRRTWCPLFGLLYVWEFYRVTLETLWQTRLYDWRQTIAGSNAWQYSYSIQRWVYGNTQYELLFDMSFWWLFLSLILLLYQFQYTTICHNIQIPGITILPKLLLRFVRPENVSIYKKSQNDYHSWSMSCNSIRVFPEGMPVRSNIHNGAWNAICYMLCCHISCTCQI